jgi:transcriptional regulator GlxA family with amidase domain
MVRFEEVLVEHLSRPLQMQELRDLIVVSDRTLRLCCTQFLGMSPTRHVLLRRLTEVRRGLRDADTNLISVAEVAHRFGFSELGRFAGHIGRPLARPHRPLSNSLRERALPSCEIFPISA